MWLIVLDFEDKVSVDVWKIACKDRIISISFLLSVVYVYILHSISVNLHSTYMF